MHAQIYAFDTSASAPAGKGRGAYSSAACRTTLYIRMASQPTSTNVTNSQLFLPSADASQTQRRKLEQTLQLAIILGGLGFVFIVAALFCCCGGEQGCCRRCCCRKGARAGSPQRQLEILRMDGLA
jgi:hypothetical protein